MPTPDFILELRSHVGQSLLWLPGVAAVVFREAPDGVEEVLLVRRSDTGSWTVVTGILDPGEEPAVGAIREVLEETCVVARADRLVWAHATPEVEFVNGDRSCFLSLCFRCTWLSGQAAPGDDESSEVGWFRLDHLPPMSENQLRRIELAAANAPEAVFAQ